MLVEVILGNKAIANSHIDVISITESIYSPIVTGIIQFNDTGFLDDEFTFSDNLNLNILLHDDVLEKRRELSFMVYGIDITQPDLKSYIHSKKQILFASYWIFPMNTHDYFVFDNRTSIEMLRVMGNRYGFELEKVNDSVSNKWTYLTPGTYSNLQNIDYILNNTVTDDGKGGFLMFPNMYTNMLNVLTYSDLYDGKIGNYDETLLYDTGNDGYIGSVSEIFAKKEYNLLKLINAFNTISYGYDIENHEIISDSKNLYDSLRSDKNIIGDIPISKDIINKYKNITVGSNGSDDLISTKKEDYYDFIFNQYSLELTVTGDYNRRVGMTADSILINMGDGSSATSIDVMRSGKFIISDIEHNLYGNNYAQKCKLIRPGYNSVDKNVVKFEG